MTRTRALVRVEDADRDRVGAPQLDADRRPAAGAAALRREAVLRVDDRPEDGALRQLQPLGDREGRCRRNEQADESRRREEPLQSLTILRSAAEKPVCRATSSMFLPVTISTVGRGRLSRSASASGAAAAPSARIPASAYARTPPRAPPRSTSSNRWTSGFSSATASGIATRAASPSANVDARSESTGDAGAPALPHRRRLGRGDRDAERVRRPARDRAEDADRESAVPDRDDDGAGLGQLVEQLVADRLVALELRRLVAVLEEVEAVLVRRSRAPPPSPRPCRRRPR